MQLSNRSQTDRSQTDDPIHASLDAHLICSGLEGYRSELIEDTLSQHELKKLEKSGFFQEIAKTARRLDKTLQEKAGLTKYLKAEASGNNDASWRDRPKRMYAELAKRSTNSCLQTVQILSAVHDHVSEMILLSQASEIHSVDEKSVRVCDQRGDDQICDRPSKKGAQNTLSRFIDECRSADIKIPDSLVAYTDGGYTTEEVVLLTRSQPSPTTPKNENPLMCKHTKRLKQMSDNNTDMFSPSDNVNCGGCVLTRHCNEIGLT